MIPSTTREKKNTKGATAIQAFDSITIHSNLVKSEMAIVLVLILNW